MLTTLKPNRKNELHARMTNQMEERLTPVGGTYNMEIYCLFWALVDRVYPSSRLSEWRKPCIADSIQRDLEQLP